MARPIVVATIGYIIGIITGLYLKSIVPFYAFMVVFLIIVYLITKFKSYNRYFRYIKLILNFQTIILILITSIIGFLNISQKEKEYQETYKNMEQQNNIEAEGIVVSNKIEKDFNNIYRIKIYKVNGKQVKSKKFYCYINKDQKDIKYGNKVKLKGIFLRPKSARNENTFNYENYLKIKTVYGAIKVKSIETQGVNTYSPILKFANDINLKIKENAKSIKDEKIRSVYLGIVLGDTSTMDDETQMNFREAGMSHILAVSGMHISYLIICSVVIFKSIFNKRIANIITSLIIIVYILITGFSSSIARAGIMGIILLFSNVFYRKNDMATSISLSLLILIIVNPYLITDVGLQLSYSGTIGIILFRKPILKMMRKIKIKDKTIRARIPRFIIKISDKIKEVIAITLAAQIMILPISIYQFNLFSSYFIITNFFVSLIIGIAYIIAIIFTIMTFINIGISIKISFFLNQILKLIIFISEIPNKLIGSKIYLPSPTIIQIGGYYIFIFILFYIANIKSKRKRNMSEQRVLNLIALAKFRYREMSKRKKRIIFALIISIFMIAMIIPKDLEIKFLDVDQGDSTFISTPSKKTILVDGGEDEETVFQYLLKNGYLEVDYIIISHFDSDHVNGIFTVLENLKVNNVIIAKQVEDSENYKKFLDIINQKNIKVITVKKGDRIKIDNDCYFDILWPDKKPISENAANNNAIVAKFVHKDFSCLFTGDIEDIAEKEIIQLYNKELNSTILKVAHHGSKTSSTQEFLEKVKPQIALIGVGKDNKFGHPNEEVISRLQKFTDKIYRTDLKGEICINFTRLSIIRIKYLIEDKK